MMTTKNHKALKHILEYYTSRIIGNQKKMKKSKNIKGKRGKQRQKQPNKKTKQSRTNNKAPTKEKTPSTVQSSPNYPATAKPQ